MGNAQTDAGKTDSIAVNGLCVGWKISASAKGEA